MISGFKIEYLVNNAETGENTMEQMAVAFERAGDEMRDFGTYLFPRMVPVFEAEMAAQFSSEGRGPNAGHWAPLSEQYAKWKQEHYGGKPILVAEGTLQDALTSSGSPFAKRVISGDTFDFGTVGVEYASYHQLGTGRMPARPEYDFGDDFERALTAEGAAAAREAISRAGADQFLDVEP